MSNVKTENPNQFVIETTEQTIKVDVKLKPKEEPQLPSLEIKPDWLIDVCFVCAIESAVTKSFVLSRLDSKKDAYCPNGHSGKWSRKFLEDISLKLNRPMENFAKETCCQCGINFMLESDFKKQRKCDFKIFHCPNGCQQIYRKPDPPAPTPQEVDYQKMIQMHSALSTIALFKTKPFSNKKALKAAINIARNVLELSKYNND